MATVVWRWAQGVSSALLCLGAVPVAASAPHCESPPNDSPIPAVHLTPVATGFRQPVFVTGDHAVPPGLLVVEQAGRIRRVDFEAGRPGAVFLDISERVTSGGETGLLGLALHPDFTRNGRFFVNYTVRASGIFGKLLTRVSEFRVDPGTQRVETRTERVLLEIEQPYSNHNAGMLAFGSKGYLYVATGDGGSANDPGDRAQNLETLLGKILRIDVDSSPVSGLPYAIPSDNPFVGGRSARPEIFAYGLRNPWRFSIDRVSGLIYAGDVGQDHREEVDVVRAGGNYGWRIMEGRQCTPGINRECRQDGLVLPIVDYPRPQGFSITDGYVYRGTSAPTLCGVYLYAEFGSGRMWDFATTAAPSGRIAWWPRPA